MRHTSFASIIIHIVKFVQISGMWLFFAWFAFNAGSSGGISDPAALASAERALINTLLGGTSGKFI